MSIKSRTLLLVGVMAMALPAAARAETFFSYLTPAQEVPTNASTATGYARIFVNESALTINYTIVFNGLAGAQTGAHIHAPAAIGVNTGVAIGFPNVGGTSGTITGSTTITAMQISQLRAQLGYVNVHSATFPGGEIRGQLAKKRPVDFDGDGRQDYSIWRIQPPFTTGDPQWITWYNLNSTTGVQISGPFGNWTYDYPTPGDYDGDGRDDLAIYRRGGSGGGPQNSFWILRSSDNAVQTIFFGASWDKAVNRDYDGDGITDVAIYRNGASGGGQSTWWIRRSSLGLNTPASDLVIPFGTAVTVTNTGEVTAGDIPIPGDYDGDGKFDVAVYRIGGVQPNNTFIVRRSTDGTVTFRTFGDFQTDWILPGDYDGDGKFDYAIGRLGTVAAPNYVWWIEQSSNGQIRVQTFGVGTGKNTGTNDLPVQGDYDGDGRTDLAIYRRAQGGNGFFWVYNSLSGSITLTPWGTSFDFLVDWPIARFDAR